VLRNVTSDFGEVGEDAWWVPGEVWHIVANVEKLLGTNRAGHVEDFVNAVAEAVDEFGLFGGVRSNEDVALHVFRDFESEAWRDSPRK